MKRAVLDSCCVVGLDVVGADGPLTNVKALEEEMRRASTVGTTVKRTIVFRLNWMSK